MFVLKDEEKGWGCLVAKEMFIRVCALILAVALATSTSSAASSEEAIVTSEKIDWKTFDEGMSEIKQSGKPGIVLIQRPSCPACRNLNAILARSTKIQDLSKSFVMIRCNSGENLHDEAYKGGCCKSICLMCRWFLCATSLFRFSSGRGSHEGYSGPG